MLSLGKLTSGHQDYYEREVASGAEDYYAMRGEASGQWLGVGAAGLDLAGRAEGGELGAMLEGRDPATGETLRVRPVEVTGFDVTFSPPKSVSVLFAAGDRRVGRETAAAHASAVRKAFAVLEREACWTRRGAGGAIKMRGEGFVAAEYVHRLSRAGDAQLHSHVVIANMTRAEGRWTTLDGTALYDWIKTADALYQSTLRAEMTERLGVEWERVAPRHLGSDISGVPKAVLADQSRRRGEIVERMAERGESSARAAQVAALDTRKAKDYDVPERNIAAELQSRIAEMGFGRDELAQVIDRTRREPLTRSQLSEHGKRMLGAHGLTEHRSTFSRQDAIQAWAARHDQGEHPERVLAVAERWLASRHVVELPAAGLHADNTIRRRDGQVVASLGGAAPRYSTWRMIASEQRLIDTVTAGRNSGAAVVGGDVVDRVIARHPTLSEEQARLVRELTTSGHRVEQIEAAAGAGKTYALGVAVEAFQAAGHRVIGTSTSNVATRHLEDEAGVLSWNTTVLLMNLDAGEALQLGTVVLMDEAGMVGSDKYARIAEHVAAARGKLIATGDSRQLAAIEAGGAFRAISERFGAVSLSENRRQVDPAEIEALGRLRKTDPAAYVRFEHQRGRLTVGTSHENALSAQLADWWSAVQHHPDQEAVLVARMNADVAALNLDAHRLLDAAGQLGGDRVTAGGREFAVGDHVRTLKNHRGLNVDNGDRGIVTVVDPGRRSLTVHLRAGREVTLPDWYLDEGNVTYGYALTAYAVQGSTVDRTFALGAERMYAQEGYVIASRARHETRFYLSDYRDEAGEQAPGPPVPPPNAIVRFAEHLSESREQEFAIDEPARARARALATPQLRSERARVASELADFPSAPARELEQLTDRLGRLDADRAQAERESRDARAELDALGPVKRHGKQGDELRTGLQRAQAQVDYLADQVDAAIEQMAALRRKGDPVKWIERHADQVRDLRAMDDELVVRDRRAQRQLVRAAQSDPPEHVTAVLGERPENYGARLQWERGVWAIEVYRHRQGIPPNYDDTALGREPARGQDRQRWRETVTTVRQVRAELGLEPQRGEMPEVAAVPDRLAEPADRGIQSAPLELGYDR